MWAAKFTHELKISSDRQSLSTPFQSIQHQHGVQQKNVYRICSDGHD